MYVLSSGEWSDCKSQRITALACWLKSNASECEILCLQECYSTLLLPGNFRDRVMEACRDVGFAYCAAPSRIARFPGTSRVLGPHSPLVLPREEPPTCRCFWCFTRRRTCNSSARTYRKSYVANTAQIVLTACTPCHSNLVTQLWLDHHVKEADCRSPGRSVRSLDGSL